MRRQRVLEKQGDRKGLPYMFAETLRVGETLAVSLLLKRSPSFGVKLQM